MTNDHYAVGGSMRIGPHGVVVIDVDHAVAVDVAEDRRHGPVDAEPSRCGSPTRSWLLTTPSSLKSPGRTSSRRVKVAMTALPMVIVTRSAALIGWARVIV